MLSEETRKLLHELERLSSLADASVATRNERFENAVDALDEMAGRPRQARGAEFEQAVWRVLSGIPGVVVAREPQTAASQFRPDFLVAVDDQRVLVEAKSPVERMAPVARRLADAIEPFHADRALVVVQDDAESAGEADLVDDARLSFVGVRDLRDFFAGLPRR